MVKMQVIGHLGKDAIVNNVNGKTVINFSIAHTEKFKDAQGQQKEKTLWVEAAWWTDKTGIVQYLKKGQQVYADGQPDVRTYTTPDGRTGSSLVLRVSQVQLVGGNKNPVDHTAEVNEMTARNYGGGGSDIEQTNEPLPF